MRNILPKYAAELQRVEALRFFAYPDPASPLAKATPGLRKQWGFKPAEEILRTLPNNIQELSGVPWTCGFGHTRNVDATTTCDKDLALSWFNSDTTIAKAAIEREVLVPLNDAQFAALVSFVFNIGVFAFSRSTLLVKLNRRMYNQVPTEMRKWNKTRNRLTKKLEVNQGLVNRREIEISMWESGDTLSQDFHVAEPRGPEDLPVAPAGTEAAAAAKPAHKSRTLTGSAMSTAGALGGALTEASDQLGTAALYSEYLQLIFTVITLAGIALVVYAKMDERKQEKG